MISIPVLPGALKVTSCLYRKLTGYIKDFDRLKDGFGECRCIVQLHTTTDHMDSSTGDQLFAGLIIACG